MADTLWLLFWLIGAHYIGDIALQSDWMATMKGKRWYILCSHVMIWTTAVCIPLEYFGVLQWWMPLFLFAGHYISDEWKSSKPKTDENWYLIYYDQAVHGLQLFIVWWLSW